MACQQVKFHVENGIGTILLDDPDSKNALSPDVIEELARLFAVCEYDEEVHIVVLRGAGGTFSSGGNIRSLKEQIVNHSFKRDSLGNLGDAARRLKDLSKPTICVVEGAAAGAGVSLAMNCDFSIASEKAKFTCAFVNLALVPDTGGTELLVKTAGVNKAKELLLGGGLFTAKEAQDWGVITWAVEEDKVEQKLNELIDKLLHTSPEAYRRIKTLIHRCAYPNFDAGLAGETEYQYESCISEDHKEGVFAFLEKRKPDFHKRP